MWRIKTNKEEIVLSHDIKELFVQRFTQVFDQSQERGDAKSKNSHENTRKVSIYPDSVLMKKFPKLLYWMSLLTIALC